MSGSSRKAPRRALAKERVWTPTSRCCTRQFWLRCTNSIGSSTVMMWSCRWRLAKSIMAARVVDFPEPVGPVTRIRPFFSSGNFFSTGGNPRSSTVDTFDGIKRKTARSEEHTSELQSRRDLVCRLLLEKKKKKLKKSRTETTYEDQ